MSKKLLAGLALVTALSGCLAPIPPSQTPPALRDHVARGLFAEAGAETCPGLKVNDARLRADTQEVIIALINAGYSSESIDAMIAGLEQNQDWLIPYFIRFDQTHNFGPEDITDEQFCAALAQERRQRTPIGVYLR